MAYETLLLEVQDGIALAKVNRPKALNALNPQVLEDLSALIDEVESREDVKLVILRGEGEKAFVAGADIAAMQTMTALDAQKFCDLGHGTMLKIERCPKPVIAAVQGFCLGGGLELALACDFIYATENSKLGLPEVNLGLFPGFGGTQRLARLIGKARAKELIYSARMLGATEAEAWGIVNKVTTAESLMSEVEKTAREILKKAPVAIALAKRAVNDGSDLDLRSGLSLEAALFPLIFATEDRGEGVGAFLEKRAANFKGK